MEMMKLPFIEIIQGQEMKLPYKEVMKFLFMEGTATLELSTEFHGNSVSFSSPVDTCTCTADTWTPGPLVALHTAAVAVYKYKAHHHHHQQRYTNYITK